LSDEPEIDNSLPLPLNVVVVECAVCHEELVNLVTRWEHEPKSAMKGQHVPEPQPRIST
jgi:hypothetical protein